MAYSEEFDDITIPAFKRIRVRSTEDSLVIPVTEWDSLMSRIAACKVSVQFRMLAASVAFAVGVTAGLSIIPIAFAQLPIWVLMAYIAAFNLGVGLGLGLVIAARSDARSQHSDIDGLLADMGERRAPFPTLSPEPPEPGSTLS